MSQALSFNEISLVPFPVKSDNQTWLRAADLARALGYRRPDILSKLYSNNADEFTPDMTQVVEIVAEHQNGVADNLSEGRCRIFSLRGCHLLAMFSRTPVAKAFRKWVLDVLDRMAAEEEHAALPGRPAALTQSTADDRKPLRSLVHAWAQVSGTSHQALWPQVKAHFQLARIDDLPVEWIPDALAFVQGKIDGQPKALSEAKPVHIFQRMGLTPLEELQMGSPIKRMFDGLDMDKIGPRTMEALVLKAKYVNAISEVYRLNRHLLKDMDRLMHDINGPAMKALNKSGCFADPVADTLHEPRERLDRINEEYRAAARAALDGSICMAMMVGV
ncbi:BRO-N domain-containing protein [Desulfovibrio falkowii]|uniref:Bro-N domain-containing protein n=1 Tax=Desulfovibrio falkowii TaxID=3136602 RepID=A0ABQ0EA43_9BACT